MLRQRPLQRGRAGGRRLCIAQHPALAGRRQPKLRGDVHDLGAQALDDGIVRVFDDVGRAGLVGILGNKVATVPAPVFLGAGELGLYTGERLDDRLKGLVVGAGEPHVVADRILALAHVSRSFCVRFGHGSGHVFSRD